jgi:hypothetical protein
MKFLLRFHRFITILSGILTFFFLMALPISIAPSWPLGALIGLGLCLLFGGIIYWGVKRSKASSLKPVILSQSLDQKSLHILLKESLNRFQIKWWGIFGAMMIFLAFINFQFWLASADWNQNLDLILGLNGLVLIVFGLVTFTYSKSNREALKLLQRTKVRMLELTPKEIIIPIELLTSAMWHKVVHQNETSLSLFWSDIESWETHPSQYSLVVKKLGRLGIIRSPEVIRQETEFLDFVSSHLSYPVD